MPCDHEGIVTDKTYEKCKKIFLIIFGIIGFKNIRKYIVHNFYLSFPILNIQNYFLKFKVPIKEMLHILLEIMYIFKTFYKY